jgi:hypothetical protein
MALCGVFCRGEGAAGYRRRYPTCVVPHDKPPHSRGKWRYLLPGGHRAILSGAPAKGRRCELGQRLRLASGPIRHAPNLPGRLGPAFQEKAPRHSGWINAGLYIIRRTWWEKHAFPPAFSWETYLQEALQKPAALRLYAHQLPNLPFIDIGIPEDYDRAQTYLPAHA